MFNLLLRLIFTFIASLPFSVVFSQSIKWIQIPLDSDSSYYHIAKVSANEFWVGGEYGVLNKVDTLGNINSIIYPGTGAHILNITPFQHFVFLTTDRGEVIRFDLISGIWKYKQFDGFSKKAFYSATVLSNGRILLGGGSYKIAYGSADLPRGFIGSIDTGLANIQMHWRSYRKFVWSVNSTSNGMLAAVFNGRRSKLMQSVDGSSWKKIESHKGLIYEIVSDSQNSYFCGGLSHQVTKPGFVFDKNIKTEYKVDSAGMFFAVKHADSILYGVSHNGILMTIENSNLKIVNIKKGFPLYDFEFISARKILIGGHGKLLCIYSF